jgi:hypothetical protein
MIPETVGLGTARSSPVKSNVQLASASIFSATNKRVKITYLRVFPGEVLHNAADLRFAHPVLPSKLR